MTNFDSTTHAYIRQGAEIMLTLAAADKAGSITLTLGTQETKISIENGEITPTKVTATAGIGAANGELTLTVSTVEAPVVDYTVTMNDGVENVKKVNEKIIFNNLPKSAHVVALVNGELTDLSGVVNQWGSYEYTVALANATESGSTDIKLYTAWEVTVSGVELYESSPAVATGAPEALAEDLLVKTTEDKTLFIKHDTKNVYLVSDVVDLTNVRMPSQRDTDGEGVWSFVVTADVSSSSFTEDVTIDTTDLELGALVKDTAQKFGSVVTLDAGSKATVTVSFKATGWTTPNVAAKYDSTDGIVLTPDEAKADGTSGEKAGELTVSVKLADGKTMTSVITVNWQ